MVEFDPVTKEPVWRFGAKQLMRGETDGSSYNTGESLRASRVLILMAAWSMSRWPARDPHSGWLHMPGPLVATLYPRRHRLPARLFSVLQRRGPR